MGHPFQPQDTIWTNAEDEYVVKNPGENAMWSKIGFIVVVIGGMGSFWGTFWGSVIYGQVLAFGILIFPGFSLFSVFALMAVILIVRPWGLFGRPL